MKRVILGNALRIFDAFVDAGGNFIDTANVYTLGTSERFLGKFLEEKRDYRISQLEDNLGCLKVTFSSEHLARLDEVSRIKFGFPRECYKNDLIKGMVFTGTRDRTVAHRATLRE